MDEIKPVAKKKRSTAAKIANVFSYILICLFFLVVLAVLLIQTAPVQNFVRGKLQTYLQNKLKTKVEIGKMDIRFPNSILLKNVYIEDQTKDTLLSGGMLKVDIDMLRLLKSDVVIKEIDLGETLLKIKRINNDTVFNYQFISDAFMGGPKKASTADTTGLKMKIDKIIIDKTRIIYQDVMTGNDMNLYFTHFDTNINTFDPYHLNFDIPVINFSGVKGYFYQNEPLKPKIIEAVAAAVLAPETYVQLKSSVWNFSDIDVDYKSAPTHIEAAFKISSLVAHPDTLNIKEGKFDFKDLALTNSNISFIMSNAPKPAVTNTQLQNEKVLPSFTIKSDNLEIKNTAFTLNNTSMPVLKYGMDYGHLDLKEANFKAQNLFYNSDTMAAVIKSASLKEKSGFVLEDLNVDFLFDDNETALQNLYIKTPGTVLRRSAIIRYPSLDKLIANPMIANLDLDIVSSRVLVKDLLIFAPQLRSQPSFSNPSQTLMLNGRIKGPISNLHFYDLRLQGIGETTLFFSGSVSGLPDPNKFSADLDINYLKTTKRDILSFLPKNSLPAGFNLPESISAKGKIKGNMKNLFADVTIATSAGAARFNGTLQNIMNPKLAAYNISASAMSLNIGAIMQNPNLGMFTGSIKAHGKGFDPATANASFNGVISVITLNKYDYKNVKVIGTIANKIYNINASIHDPNIDLSLQANGSFETKYPSVHLVADVDSIKTLPLHLTTQAIIYHGKIEADFTNTDPDNLTGNALVTHSVLVNDGQRTSFDSLEIVADNSP
ncbi:MAG: hypothetical protein H0W12_06975, partial [Chitinophagaceae bacterium]|nr:hypothetical protein [Chitinophagaceae bacterium]